MKTTACLALALAVSTAATALAGDRFGPKADLESLSGSYASTAPEPWYGGFGTREFAFSGGNWSLVFTHALDPEMRRKTFRFRTEGPYAVGAPSRVVDGAFEAVFYENFKFVTLFTDDAALAAAMGLAACGLRVGEETDISARGCAGWKPVAICREDHDLLAIGAAGLYFGVRPRDNDMCTADKRPTALLMPVVRR